MSTDSPSGLRSRRPAPDVAEDALDSIEPFLTEESTQQAARKLEIQWAPLDVPMHRRLQTTAVVLTLALIPVSIFLILFCVLLPPLWLPFGVYVAFVLTDNAYESGGRPIEFVKNLFVWNCPIELEKTVDLPPDRNYIMGYHPHGIISVGAFVNFATNSTGFPHLFPGIQHRLCTLAPNFKVPFLATVLLSLGTISVSRESIRSVVKPEKDGKGTGKAAIVVVGGAEEALYAKPGAATLVLGKRFGFVKLALQNGASLVPIYSFGENDLYDQEDQTATTKKINAFTKRTYGTTFPLFHGRGIFSYNFGILPYRHRVVTVVGEPIDCPLIENPTEEEVKEFHDRYLDGLRKIWDTNKGRLNGGRAATLVIR